MARLGPAAAAVNVAGDRVAEAAAIISGFSLVGLSHLFSTFPGKSGRKKNILYL